jgi:hypothetical protein
MPAIKGTPISFIEDSFRCRISDSFEPTECPISMLLLFVRNHCGVNMVGTGGLEPPTSTASR